MVCVYFTDCMYTKIRFFRKHFFNLCFKIFLTSYRSNRTRIKNFFIFNKTTYYFFIYKKSILNKTIFLRKIQNPSVISRDSKIFSLLLPNKSLIAILYKKKQFAIFLSQGGKYQRNLIQQE